MARSQDVPFGRAWLCLCLALLLHVTDEALTGFLRIYNPFVTTLRQKIPWLPFPTFEFHVWLAGLLGACAVLLLLTRVAYRGATWLRPLAYVFSAFMILNALGHTAGTIAGTRLFSPPVPHPMPGFYSSPFLMVASIYLLYQLRANRISHRSGTS